VSSKTPSPFKEMRKQFYAAVVCDVLDSLGYRHQSPQVGMRPLTLNSPDETLVGRCKTTQWVNIAYKDPHPYALELQAVDECQSDDVLIAAAGGSLQSGVWGELLTTAALNRGCVGAIVDGAIRDVAKISALAFPVFARATSVYDSLHRQRVVEVDVPVEIGGVVFAPGDLVVADDDGVVVIPQHVEQQTIELVWKKIADENHTREAIKNGMKAGEAYKKYGVL
jgi:regulator of RNase E activity RraA